MPSTTSSSVSRLLASSTVMTPSLPTFFIASARKRPISESPLAEIVPTCAISSFELIAFECFFRSSTTALTARSMPRFRSIGFMPAATDNCVGEHGCGGGAIACLVRGLARNLAYHLCAHVLELVFEFDLLGDSDAVLG